MGDTVIFVHAADLHLGAAFQGVSATDERVGAALAQATYDAFTRVVDVCLESQADFLVISGDAYNSADKSYAAQRAFHREVLRLSDAGISVFMVQGNHDPARGWSAGLEMPDSVHVFPTGRTERVEYVRDGEVVAAIYGRSFATASELNGFAHEYRRDATDPIAIGVLHANVGGDPDYDPYAPATLDELRTGGMDYWALGHIHKHQVLAKDPWIVYAGSPQGLNPKETGVHGCMVVEIGRAGVMSARHVETARVSWALQTLDVSDAESIEDVRRAVDQVCDEALANAEGRCVVVRLILTGRSGAHGDLARPGALEDLLGDVRAERATVSPWVHVDRLTNRSSRRIELDQVRNGPDFSAEIVRIGDELESDPSRLEKMLTEVVAGVMNSIPGIELEITPLELLEQARDEVLDLLVPDTGDMR